MDQKEPEELCNTGPEEETLQKKRSRRVSFAEITSVHVFDRDEDYETPPDSKPSSENPEWGEAKEDINSRRDSCDSDESKDLSQNEDDVEAEDEEVGELFVRDVDSSSPGSAIGSAASNDEDNFFGPVSASFIKSGQLSNSATSDDNHDITLDSTAFSWHFRSLVQLHSGGDHETSAGGSISLEEKTPTQNPTMTNMGSFMVLTDAKKPLPRCSVSDGRSSGGCDSNDMSLIEDNPHRYDYGRLSPGLNALLAEGCKDLNAVSDSVNANSSKPPHNLNRNNFVVLEVHESRTMNLKDSRCNGMVNIESCDRPEDMITDVNYKLHATNGGSMSHNGHIFSTDAPTDQQNQTLNEATKVRLLSFSDGDETPLPGSGETPLPNLVKDKPFSMEKDFEDVTLELRGSKSEIPSDSRGSLRDLNEMLQTSLIKQHESECQSENSIKQNSPKGGRLTPDVGQNFDQNTGSPLLGSVASLSVKRRKIYLNTEDSTRNEWKATPFAGQQPLSSVSRKNTTHDESVSSIKQRISKFEILNISPASAPLELGVHNSEPEPSVSSDHVINENYKDREQEHVDVSVSGLEGHMLSVAQRNRGQKINMESSEVKTLDSIGLFPFEESIVPAEGGEHVDLAIGILGSGQYNNISLGMASPFQFTCSEKKMKQNFLTSESPFKPLVISEPDSSLAEATIHFRGSEQGTCISDKFIRSPVKTWEKKSSDSLEHEALKQPGCEPLSFGKRVDGEDLIGNALHESLTPVTDKLGFSSVHERMCSRLSPARVYSHSMHFGQLEAIALPDLQIESRRMGEYKTPLSNGANLNDQSESRSVNLQTKTDPTLLKRKIQGRELKYSFCESASPYISKRATIVPNSGKSLVELTTQSPHMKEFFNSSDIDSTISYNVAKNPRSPKSIQCARGNGLVDCHHGHHVPEDQQSVRNDVENSSGQKRRSEDIIFWDKEKIEELGSIQKSPKVCKRGCGGSEVSFEQSNLRNTKAVNIGNGKMPMHWGDVFLRFCGTSKQLFLPSAGNLCLQELDNVEDILVWLQKAKKYEKLSSYIRSQRIHDHLGSNQHHRVYETRWTLHLLAYEYAKLQLMRVKRDRLLKSAQFLNSGIQECEMLKLKTEHLILPGVRYDQNMDRHLKSILFIPNGKNEDAHGKVIAMRQELGVVDQKIKNLTKSFHSTLKFKGKLGTSEIIVSVNDYLKKRSRCRVVHQGMQLWNVDILERRDGCHNVGLNYSNFLFQRLTINVSRTPSLGLSSKLNDSNILKNFPNMNAYTAFAFVLNSELTQKHSPKNLSRLTQITSSLLGNLLDVVEEIEAACWELPNLIETSFQSSFDEQLNLELCFLDFKTGGKVILSLDMGCLKGGIYPADILPSKLQSHPHYQSLSNEIITATGGLKAGHSRIMRLCRCVSQIIQASRC